MRIRMLALFLLLGLAACQKPSSPLGVAADYYPPTAQLRKGIVNKYYLHFTSADGYERSTNVSYYLYQLDKEGQLEITRYDPAYSPMIRTLTTFQGTQQQVLMQEQFWQKDSFPVEVNKNVIRDWAADTASYITSTAFMDEIVEDFQLRQLSQYDSLATNRELKVFNRERSQVYRYADGTERSFQAEIQEVYAKGLGLYGSKLNLDDGIVEIELVEQFPATEFRKRQAAAPMRVAYIDPTQVLDKGSDFQVCDDYIYDYYNGDPDAGPVGGKRRLSLWLEDKLDKRLLADQSGYLTFRFVINCEGDAGYFITEEASLDFAVKQFPDQLIQHVYEQLKAFDNWEPTTIREEVADAYAYVTLKLEDGELVDILP